jgi:pimeloyl-ACP methyl ester carboxylesterase
MHDAISSSRLVEIAQAGHLANMEAPEPFNAGI